MEYLCCPHVQLQRGTKREMKTLELNLKLRNIAACVGNAIEVVGLRAYVKQRPTESCSICYDRTPKPHRNCM